MRTNNALVKNSQRSTRNAKIAHKHPEAMAQHAEKNKHGIPKPIWDAHTIPVNEIDFDETEVNFSLTPRLFDEND
jgi:hypothetical protein